MGERLSRIASDVADQQGMWSRSEESGTQAVSLTRVAIVESEAQLAVMQCLLEAPAIPYFVHSRHLGSMLPALYVPLYNTVSIMVPPAFAFDAQNVLRELQAADVPPATPSSHPRVRCAPCSSGLLFGWAVPGTRRRDADEQHSQSRGP